jgi:hypothetical protein
VARASPQQHRPPRAGGSGRVDMPLAIDLGRARKKLEKKKTKKEYYSHFLVFNN